MNEPELLAEATALTANLFRQLVLRPDGTLIGDSPEEWVEADATEPELVAMGGGTLQITATGDDELATAVDACDDEGDAIPTMKALYVPNAADGERPVMGDLLSLETDEGPALAFRVMFTHADFHAPSDFDLGPDALVNEQLAALQEGEIVLALLVDLSLESVEATS